MEEKTEKLLEVLSEQLTAQSVNAVSLKLPEFWTKSPDVWFAKVEAQFGIKGITKEQTKYDYLVSALDVTTAEEVQYILLHPPAEDKYTLLKNALLKAFGKTQSQKDLELLNLNGLGDRRPTALMRKINALNNDPNTLKRALFLSNLPADVRTILAGLNIDDVDALAEAADRIYETRSVSIQHISADDSSATSLGEHHSNNRNKLPEVDAFKYKNKTQGSSSNKDNSVCYYHSNFGPNAKKCKPGCKFASLLNKDNSGNDQAGRP